MLKILVAEDEMTSRLIVKKILSAYGDVSVCEDGQEAIRAFEAAHTEGRPFDLICMDFMMPGMDGREALAHIRMFEKEKNIHHQSRVKVILLTGMSTIESEYEDIKVLCDAIVQKPVRKDSLIAAVDSLDFTTQC